MLKSLPQLIAHRGASAFAPENTLAAFELAKIMNATMFECDVQLSHDEVPIIIHDDTLDRTTHGQGFVHEFSYSVLKNFAIRNRFDLTQYSFAQSLCIPSLADTLNWCLANHMALNLELKVNQHAPTASLVTQVLKVIRTMPVQLTKLMVVSSFDWEKLSEFHDGAPEFPVAILIDQHNLEHYGLEGIQGMALELEAISLNIDVHLLTPKLIMTLKEYAPQVFAYTVNDLETAQSLFSQGLDGIFSNNPLLLQKLT
jgi:glycerophosphoryl diester phosphodiesterase